MVGGRRPPDERRRRVYPHRPSASMFTRRQAAPARRRGRHAGSTLPLAERRTVRRLADEPSAMACRPLDRWFQLACRRAASRRGSLHRVNRGRESASRPDDGTGDGRPGERGGGVARLRIDRRVRSTVGDRATTRRAGYWRPAADCGAAAASIGAAGLMWARRGGRVARADRLRRLRGFDFGRHVGRRLVQERLGRGIDRFSGHCGFWLASVGTDSDRANPAAGGTIGTPPAAS